MNKRHIVQRVALEAGVTTAQASAMLTALEATVASALSTGEDVRLTGLGVLQVKPAKPRATYSLTAKRVGWRDGSLLIRFQASEKLKDAVYTAWTGRAPGTRNKARK